MCQNGAEIGRIFVTLQNKQGKTTKVSMLLFRLLVLNEYTSDFRADCTHRKRITCGLFYKKNHSNRTYIRWVLDFWNFAPWWIVVFFPRLKKVVSVLDPEISLVANDSTELGRCGRGRVQYCLILQETCVEHISIWHFLCGPNRKIGMCVFCVFCCALFWGAKTQIKIVHKKFWQFHY